MRSIAFAIYPGLAEVTASDALLAQALRSRGIQVQLRSWHEGVDAFAAEDAVLIRSTWDYHVRPAQFAGWLDSLERRELEVINPVPTLRWNSNKRYLLELAALGIPIVPTVFWEQTSPLRVDEVLRQIGPGPWVAKPSISAGAYRTHRVRSPLGDDDRATLEALHQDGAVLVQPFLEEIQASGEWSFVFFAGALSHALRKKPAQGDFRVHVHLGGTATREDPPAPLRAQAEAIASRLPVPWVYARIDAVVLSGTLTLMEAELLEPDLYFNLAPEGAERFADVLVSALGQRTPR